MQLEPLSVVSQVRLKPLLEQEGHCWLRQLGWDFSSAADLIQRYVATRSLPGFALMDGGTVLGYDYYVIDQTVGYIGNLFIDQDFASAETYGLLARQTVAAMRNGSRLSRIECQLFPFNFEFPALFQDLEFEVRPRRFLSRPLGERDLDPEPHEIEGFRLVPWSDRLFMQAAAALYDSYRDSPDQRLCRDYQSMRGCVRFLRNLIESPGCGEFYPQASWIAVDAQGQVAAVLVASRIGPGKAMIPQISVRRGQQSRGLGSLLLRRCFQTAAQAGMDSISLSVSESNRGACRLYRRLGFLKVKLFHAYVWNRDA